ncbi:DUF222 domain-containing protein [Microbacterium sp. NPDC064584]|uniref:HNH endonuclease signature motif containing protein n=1 Tax=Microbacterium sp. NPDC064584 TaxID=3155817 RepID=UPI00342AC838
MHSNAVVGFTDSQTETLRGLRDQVAAFDQAIAAAEAARVRVLAQAADLVDDVLTGVSARERQADMVLRTVASEIAVAARLSDRSLQRQIGEAATLVGDYPETLASWEEGRIRRGHVRAVQDAGAILPPENRHEFDRSAAEICAEDTAGRVGPRLRVLAEQVHPISMQERHDAAHATRCVKVLRGTEGMSTIMLAVPSLFADTVYDRLTQQARVIVDTRRTPPAGLDDEQLAVITTDTRTMDQLRADLAVDMLLTGHPTTDPTRDTDGTAVLGAIHAKVQIVIPVLALLGVTDEPATLEGNGPIDATTARELARTSRSPWERILTHPVSGAVLAPDTYQRPAAIDRLLRARDRHCRFPGCRTPAIRCEVDHTIDYARGGPTDTRNLAHLCQRHHTMKQFTPWRLRQLPDGVLEWTSPAGTVYFDIPSAYPPAVAFAPSNPSNASAPF